MVYLVCDINAIEPNLTADGDHPKQLTYVSERVYHDLIIYNLSRYFIYNPSVHASMAVPLVLVLVLQLVILAL